MKTKLLLYLLFAQLTVITAQNITIDQITPTEVNEGINVNLLVTTYNGAGYLSHSYEINGNTIDLSVCYWFSLILPVFQMSNDFFIPISTAGDYMINVRIFHSSSQTTCDYFANGPAATVSFLSKSSFEVERNKPKIFPNPTTGLIEINSQLTTPKIIQVYDASGKLVKKITNLSTNYLDLSDLTNGLYLLRMENQNENWTQKVIMDK
jgi:hypothetical protein